MKVYGRSMGSGGSTYVITLALMTLVLLRRCSGLARQNSNLYPMVPTYTKIMSRLFRDFSGLLFGFSFIFVNALTFVCFSTCGPPNLTGMASFPCDRSCYEYLR